MRWIQDLLQATQEVPLSTVLRERIKLVEQKYDGGLLQIEELKRLTQRIPEWRSRRCSAICPTTRKATSRSSTM
jgi:hypothetical protein